MAKRYQLYIAEREKGKTYQEIADQFGVSRQCVQAACVAVHGPRRRNGKPSCIYPALSEWLEKNKMPVAELYRLAYESGLRSCPTSFRNHLRGNNPMSIQEAKILVKITKIPFEKLLEI